MPELLMPEDYQQAIDEFCRRNPQATIYQVGEVSHPGISDLDFIIVDQSPIITDLVEEFLCGGNVIVMPSFAMPKIRSLENFDLRLLQGSPACIEEFNNKWFDVVEIIEWLPERILLLESSRMSSLRQRLLYLKSLNRSIVKTERLLTTVFPRTPSDMIRKIASADNIENLTDEYLRVANTAWRLFEHWVEPIISGDVEGSFRFNEYYHYDSRFGTILAYLGYLSTYDCELTQSLCRRLTVTGDTFKVDKSFAKFIHQRWALLSKIFVWFKQNKINKGMIKYGWLLQE